MCGIWGYSGNKFNKYKFDILGLFNDSRGGDSCGIVINNNGEKDIQYGHDKTKLYRDFISSGAEYSDKGVNLAMGHCRKASVGAIGLDQAQPVVVVDDRGENEFIMIHNGTLINYKELANKYGVEFDHNETDSQIFCKVVYTAGYGVLSEYDGAGAFIFWDRRDDKDSIKIFKGASIYYSNDDDIYIERPLYILHSKNSTWISSMEDSLKFISGNESNPIDVEHNTLITIKNGEITSSVKYNRSERKQQNILSFNHKKPFVPSNKSSNNNNYHNSRYDSYYGYDGGYNDYYDEDYAFPNSRGSKFGEFLSREELDKPRGPKTNYPNKIFFGRDGLYRINNDVCHGSYIASPAGYVFNDVSGLNEEYWFYKGVMMKSYFNYLCAEEYDVSVLESSPEKESTGLIFLSKYSTTPVPLVLFGEDPSDANYSIAFYEHLDRMDDVIEVNGVFSPYFTFSTEKYYCKEGFIEYCIVRSNVNKYKMSAKDTERDALIKDGKLCDLELFKLIEENL